MKTETEIKAKIEALSKEAERYGKGVFTGFELIQVHAKREVLEWVLKREIPTLPNLCYFEAHQCIGPACNHYDSQKGCIRVQEVK